MIEERSGASVWASRGSAVALGALAVLGLAWIAIQATNVLILAFVAILLAAGLEPVIERLRARIPVGRGSSILLTYGTFLVTIVALAFFVVPAAIDQLHQASSDLPALLERARLWAKTIQPQVVSTSLTSLVDAASRNLKSAAPPKPDEVLAIGLTAAEAVVTVVTLLTLVFFWLTEHARLQRYALAFVPSERRAGTREAWDDVEERLGLWVRGQLTVMGTIALATGILYSVLGLPSALLLGLIAGLAEAIPLVGPMIGAVPALLVAATVSPELVGVVALAYLVIQFVEGNILVPMIMRNTMRISSFVVVVSLLIGAAVGGLLGAFLAVPIAAVAEVVLERAQARDVPVGQAPVGVGEHEDGSDQTASA